MAFTQEQIAQLLSTTNVPNMTYQDLPVQQTHAAVDRSSLGFLDGFASSLNTTKAGLNALQAYAAKSDEDMKAYMAEARLQNQIAQAHTGESFSSALGSMAGDLAIAAPIGIAGGSLAGALTGGAPGAVAGAVAGGTTGALSRYGLSRLLGTGAGAAAGSFPATYNESVNTQLEHGVEGRRALDDALYPAIGNALMDNAAFVPAISRFARGKAPSRDLGPTSLKELGTHTAMATAAEGLTGGAQFMSNLAGVNEADRDYGLFSEQSRDGAIRAALEEAVLGGTVAGGLNSASYLNNLRNPTFDETQPQQPNLQNILDNSGIYYPPAVAGNDGPNWRYGTQPEAPLSGEWMPPMDGISQNRALIDGPVYDGEVVQPAPQLDRDAVTGEWMPPMDSVGQQRQQLSADPLNGSLASKQIGQDTLSLPAPPDAPRSLGVAEPTPVQPSPSFNIPMPQQVEQSQQTTSPTFSIPIPTATPTTTTTESFNIPVPTAAPSIAPTSAPVQQAAPIDARAPVQQAAPIDARASVQQAAPIDARASVQQAAPIDARASVQQAAPIDARASVQQAAPTDARAPIQQAAPIDARASVQQAAPIDARASVQQAAPIDARASVQQAAPTDARAPIQQAAPVDARAPVQQAAPTSKLTKKNLYTNVATALGLDDNDDSDNAYLDNLFATTGYMDTNGKIDLDVDTPDTAYTLLMDTANNGVTRNATTVLPKASEYISKKRRATAAAPRIDETADADMDTLEQPRRFIDTLNDDDKTKLTGWMNKGKVRDAVMLSATPGEVREALGKLVKGSAKANAQKALDILNEIAPAATTTVEGVTEITDPEELARIQEEINSRQNKPTGEQMLQQQMRAERTDDIQNGQSFVRALFSVKRDNATRSSPAATEKDLVRILASIRRHLPNFPDPVVIRSVLNLPKELFDEYAKKRQDSPDVDDHGLFYQGTIYLFPKAFSSVDNLEETLLHEGAHAGLINALGGIYSNELLDLVTDLGGYESVKNLADGMGLSNTLSAYYQDHDRTITGLTQSERKYVDVAKNAHAVELLHEIVANVIGRKMQPSLLTKLVSKLVDALNSLGFERTSRFAKWISVKVPSVTVHALASLANHQLRHGDNNSDQRRVNNELLPNNSGRADGPLFRMSDTWDSLKNIKPDDVKPTLRKLKDVKGNAAKLKDATAKGLAHIRLSSVKAIIAMFSPELADKMHKLVLASERRKAQEINKLFTILGNSTLSEESTNRVYETFAYQTSDEKARASLTDAEYALFAKLRGFSNNIMESYIRPIAEAKFRATVNSIKDLPDDDSRMDKLARAVGRSFRPLVDKEGNAVQTTATVGYVIDTVTGEMRQVPIGSGMATHVLKEEMDNFAPRIYDYETLRRNKQQFIQDMIDRPNNDIDDAEEAERIYNIIMGSEGKTYLDPNEILLDTPHGHLKSRRVHLSNYALRGYIDASPDAMAAYLNQIVHHSMFTQEFGAFESDGYTVRALNKDTSLAKLLNDPNINQDDKAMLGEAVAHALRMDLGKGNQALRAPFAWLKAITSLFTMYTIVPMSLSEVAYMSSTQNTANKRAIARRVMARHFKDGMKAIFSESPTRAQQQARMESMGLIFTRVADKVSHDMENLAATQGWEGKANKFRNKAYSAFGAHGWARFVGTMAADIADEMMMENLRLLDDPNANKDDVAKANFELEKFGITADELRSWRDMGKPTVNETTDDKSAQLASRVADALYRYQITMATKPDSMTETTWAKTPVGGLVWLFKSFFYATGKNILPRYLENRKADGSVDIAGTGLQLMEMAIIGAAASALGMFAAHAIKYGIPSEILDIKQPPFALTNPDIGVGTKLFEIGTNAATALTGLYPFVTALERPGGVFDLSNIAVPIGFAEKFLDVDNYPKLATQLGIAGSFYMAGTAYENYQEKHKQGVDKQQ